MQLNCGAVYLTEIHNKLHMAYRYNSKIPYSAADIP